MIHIGTSGWNYDHWKGRFYPEKLPTKDWLSFYADHFRTVEINNSFYHLPQEATLEKWRKTVPDDFIFAAKASRFITHMKKLKDPRESTRKFMDVIDSLGKKLGPILFQLPPRWHFDRDRLVSFLKALSKKHQYVFEFRDSTWWNDEAYKALQKYNAAFCIYDMAGEGPPDVVTSETIYIRFHGARLGHYDDRQLKSWAQKIDRWNKDHKEVFCYFNNDAFGYALRDAIRLREILGISK